MTTNKLRIRPTRTALALALSIALLTGCDSTDSLVQSAKDYQAKKDHPAAVIQLRNALQDDPKHAEARFLLGQSLIATDDRVTAEKELRKAKELGYPTDKIAPVLAKTMLELGQVDEVIKEFGNVTLSDSQAQATLRTTVGDAYLVRNKYDEARTAYATALLTAPGYVPARVGQARLLAVQKRFDEAIAESEQILKDHPKDLLAMDLRAALFLARRQNKEAAAKYSEIISLNPEDHAARRSLISALIVEKQYEKAAVELAAAKKAGGGNDIRLIYSEALLKMQDGHPEQVRELTQKILRVAPEHMPSLLLNGAAELSLGSYAVAEEALRKVVERMPEHEGARSLLTSVYLRTGNGTKALETVKPLIEREEPSSEALALAAEAYLVSNDVERGEKMLERAAKADNNNVKVRTRLAQVHFATGEPEAAIDELQRASSASATDAQADMLLVLSHMRRSQFDRAKAAMDVLEKKSPNSPLTYNVKGALFAAMKDFKGARAAFEKALSIQGDYAPALMNLARLDITENQPAVARQRFVATIDKNGRSEQAMLAYAQFLTETKASNEEILAVLERAVKANPTSETAHLTLINAFAQARNAKAMVAAAQDAVSALPNSPAIVEIAGRAQLAAGDTNQAITTFNKLVQLQPQSVTALTRLSEAHVANKNPDGAIDALRKAVLAKPDYMPARVDIVRIQLLNDRFADAMTEAIKLQESHPKNSIGFTLEGDTNVAQQKWATAIPPYLTALKMDPNNSGVFAKLHRVYVEAGRKQDSDALTDKWMRDHPKDPVAHFYLGERDLGAKNYKGAMVHFKAIVAQRPNDVTALNNLAWAAAQVKDPSALQYAQKAYDLSPQNPAVLDTLGMVLVGQGEARKGLPYLEQAIKAAPYTVELRFNRVKALVAAGEKDKARNELQELAKHDSGKVKEAAQDMLKTL
ncbi:MAG TPA: XrtA/PEP-CTERM system TPR-repeat protein PrsT [Burkholderiales bacterium]|nr:XrtA/PEP-CTERM system TPR-repeat protein PrsT [Burkholderiales bacterium]